MSNCICDLAFGNTGGNPCSDQIGVLSRIMLVPKRDKAGVINNFANVAAVTKTALQAKFDATEIEDRFFPTPIFDNVTNAAADTVFFEADSGTKYRVREGVINVEVFYMNQGTPFYKNLKSFICNQEIAFYGTDESSNFIYEQCDGSVTVDPITIQGGTMDVKYVPKTNGEPSMVMLTFDIKLSSDYDKWKYIEYGDGTGALDFDGLDNTDVFGLLNVSSVNSAESTTSVTVALTTDFQTSVKGLIQTDFALFNVNDTLAVTILTFTESPNGTYTMTFAMQASADVMRVTPTKSRFDFSAVVTNTFIIP